MTITPAERGELAPVQAPVTGEDVAVVDLRAYHLALTAAVEQADPGPTAHADWEERERLRVSTWVRRVYENPLSAAVFALPAGEAVREIQRIQAAELALRIDIGRARSRPMKPSAEVRATAAVAAMWAVTGEALAQRPRPSRERLVSEVWAVVREIVAPRAQTPPRFVRARGAW